MEKEISCSVSTEQQLSPNTPNTPIDEGPTTAAKFEVAKKDIVCIKTGRGSTAGWTTCPLCNPHPRKQKQQQVRRYALGRGIASHLHAIHTPWLQQKSKKRKVHSVVDNINERRPQPLITTCDQGMPYPSHQPTKRQKRDLALSTSFTSESVDEEPRRPGRSCTSTTDSSNDFLWTPTQNEIDAWNTKVLQITTNLEENAILENQKHQNPSNQSSALHQTHDSAVMNTPTVIGDAASPTIHVLPPGYDRNGKLLLHSSTDMPSSSSSYQISLPTFIKAAAEGNLQQLKNMVKVQVDEVDINSDNKTKENDSLCCLKIVGETETEILGKLINTRDKHGSIAEHWAAGGGHLKCLQYLIHLRRQYDQNILISITLQTTTTSGTRRRRDGKTCLHYAARNGHIECIKYIIDEKIYPVDVTSNDGTTPLHMACYGGQIDTIWYLIEQCDANVHHANDYGCAMVHWIGLSTTLNDNTDQGHRVVELLSKLCDRYGVSFFLLSQKHGHTILHKAAQKLNHAIIEFFLAMSHLTPEQIKLIGGIPDTNGHTVSTIWRSFGGIEDLAQRIQRERNW